MSHHVPTWCCKFGPQTRVLNLFGGVKIPCKFQVLSIKKAPLHKCDPIDPQALSYFPPSYKVMSLDKPLHPVDLQAYHVTTKPCFLKSLKDRQHKTNNNNNPGDKLELSEENSIKNEWRPKKREEQLEALTIPWMGTKQEGSGFI